MTYYSRALISGRRGAAYSAIAICLVLLMLINPRIAEMVILFSFNGVVPGTNIVLPPEVVFWGVIGLFLIMIPITIWRMKLSARRNRIGRIHIPIQDVSSKTIQVQFEQEIPEPILPSIKATKQRQRSYRRIPLLLKTMFRAVGDSMKITAVKTAAVLTWFIKAVISLYTSVYKALRASLWWVSKTVILLTAGLWSLLQSFWRLVKPRLVAFDTWLEILVQRLEVRAKQRLKQYDTIRSLSTMSKEYKKTIVELHPREIGSSTKRKVSSFKDRVAATIVTRQ